MFLLPTSQQLCWLLHKYICTNNSVHTLVALILKCTYLLSALGSVEMNVWGWEQGCSCSHAYKALCPQWQFTFKCMMKKQTSSSCLCRKIPCTCVVQMHSDAKMKVGILLFSHTATKGVQHLCRAVIARCLFRGRRIDSWFGTGLFFWKCRKEKKRTSYRLLCFTNISPILFENKCFCSL